ncbi:hypothetical protein M2368_001474 [Arthrobacter sp. JUb119]|nr:hypothetical protein [Arthrobacter sp. JUb119]TDU30383.1 hypothetical protein EDF61_101342 [Arthrobacter sp. JUb115]
MELGIRQVAVGGLERAELLQRMVQTGVQLNDYAKMLLAHRIFDEVVSAPKGDRGKS